MAKKSVTKKLLTVPTQEPLFISVVVVEPGKPARSETIPNTLEAFQKLIGGGYVQRVPLRSLGVYLWCDEDGISKRLAPNTFIHEIGQHISGAFFLTGPDDAAGETLSVPKAKIPKVLKAFS